MNKAFVIALSCIAVMLAACKKPEPAPTDYSADYIGSYLGKFTLTITSVNNQSQTGMGFPLDSIRMDIAKGDSINTIVATVTIENEPYQAIGTVTKDEVAFDPIPLNLDKPDFIVEGVINMKGTKNEGKINITGDFGGCGMAFIMGQPNVFDEISGTVAGELEKQQP